MAIKETGSIKSKIGTFRRVASYFISLQVGEDTDLGEFDVFVAYQPWKQGLLNIKSNKINFWLHMQYI